MPEIKHIVIIGAGRVATQLGLALKKSGFHILQVYSRTRASAEKLGKLLNSEITIKLSEVDSNAELYIISLTDEATLEIVDKLKLVNKLVVHTSGSLAMKILKPASKNIGVFYPLQTFTIERPLDFKSIPICLEANSQANLDLLNKLAGRISSNFQDVDSDQRKILHLAAVFACNFPNFMYSIAENILKNSGLDFNILKPLILETAEKIQHVKPHEAQTGPALRGDDKIINEHLELLKNSPEFYKLYSDISKIIKEQSNKQKN